MVTHEKPMVQFYVDVISPYAWLASRELGRLQAVGVTIDCCPVLFAGFLNAHGQKGPAEIPSKRVNMAQDIVRQAAQRGYDFIGPPSHPFNPLLALRMCTALANNEERLRLMCVLLNAAWEQGIDISVAENLDRLAAQAGFAHYDLLHAAQTQEVKVHLTHATEDAIANGVFGVPTFQLGTELFWGRDRIDDLLWRLRHPDEDQKEQRLVEQFLLRQASAQRK